MLWDRLNWILLWFCELYYAIWKINFPWNNRGWCAVHRVFCVCLQIEKNRTLTFTTRVTYVKRKKKIVTKFVSSPEQMVGVIWNSNHSTKLKCLFEYRQKSIQNKNPVSQYTKQINWSNMTTYYRVRQQPNSKFVVHPHYVTEADVSNEAIVHQVRHCSIYPSKRCQRYRHCFFIIHSFYNTTMKIHSRSIIIYQVLGSRWN